jgi:hypothetical protein
MTEKTTLVPSDNAQFGPVKRIGPSRWEMDYSLAPGHHSHLEWDHEPTPDELAVAHTTSLTMTPGEMLQGRRWLWDPIEVFMFKDVGPPRWRWPRLYPVVKRGLVGLRWGWNFTAHEWTVHLRGTRG